MSDSSPDEASTRDEVQADLDGARETLDRLLPWIGVLLGSQARGRFLDATLELDEVAERLRAILAESNAE